jgi:hypothetical protein
MTKREVEDTLGCYFEDGQMRAKVPTNTTETTRGISEQWVIRRWGYPEDVLGYAYFEADRLVAIQRAR